MEIDSVSIHRLRVCLQHDELFFFLIFLLALHCLPCTLLHRVHKEKRGGPVSLDLEPALRGVLIARAVSERRKNRDVRAHRFLSN